MTKLSSLEEIVQLIGDHQIALAEHDRLSTLNDYGRGVSDAEVSAALDPIDNALEALCSARPATPEAASARKSHLSTVLVGALEGRPEMTQIVIDLLLDSSAGAQ